MSDLLETLYRFVLDHRYTVLDPEYDDFCRCAREREARLRTSLTEEQRRLLDGMLWDSACKTDVEREAVFRCGLALGLELGRL